MGLKIKLFVIKEQQIYCFFSYTHEHSEESVTELLTLCLTSS